MKKRAFLNTTFTYICLGLSIIALIPLLLIIFSIFQKGLGRISFDFFLETQPSPSNRGGGILNALLGSIYLVGLATVVVVPFSILAGFYLAENKNKLIAQGIYIFFNVLQSLPAIIIGIVAYVWLVKPLGNFSLFSGAFALGLMMFPYVTITATEIFSLFPHSIKEAAYALGASDYRLFSKVILPTASKGIFTGVLLAISRVAGESAPLLFTSFGNPYVNLDLNEPVAALPLVIFQFAISPYENWQEVAWAASLVLMVSIIFMNLMSKKLLKVKKP